MAFEEIPGNNDGAEQEDREFIGPVVGTEFEGTFVRLSGTKESRYGGPMRYMSVDLVDGRKVLVRCYKILLERVESAGLSAGDRIKVVVEEGRNKKDVAYALPRLYVDRGAGSVAPAAPVASAPVDDENPPF